MESALVFFVNIMDCWYFDEIFIPGLTKLTSNKLLPQLKLICFSLIQVLTSKNK